MSAEPRLRQLRILLLQARHRDDAARLEERDSFARAAGLSPAQIVPFDLLGGVPSLAAIRQVDALMIGGSGDYYVSRRNLPFHDATLARLAEAVASGRPLFASCFGFQLLVQALGGEIVYDPENMEVGTYPVTLTEAGRADALFGTLPVTFPAQLGRKDRAARLPDGVLHLAGSARAPYQGFRVPDRPIWATQFHPELTREVNVQRFRRYLDGYAALMSPAEVEAAISQFGDSPDANRLIGRFIRLVFG